MSGMKSKHLEKLGESVRRHSVLAMVLLGLVLLLTFVVNWRSIGTYFFYSDFVKIDKWLKEIDTRVEAGIPPASFEHLRRPIGGMTIQAQRTMPAIVFPDGPTQTYAIHGGDVARIEVGLARIEESPISPGAFTFQVYRLKDGKKRRLLDTSVELPAGSWAISYIEEWPENRAETSIELEYVLKPKGMAGRLVSMIARARGLPPYYKDFAFLAPNVLNRRGPEEQNVLVISFDTLRPDHLSCFDHSRPTSPHIDAFAERGMLFTQAISSCPWTGPAHYSLFTGLYPSAFMSELERIWEYRVHTDRLMAAVLKEHGYYTIGITGGAHVSSVKGFGIGFDQYLEFSRHREDNARRVFRTAMNWLEGNRNTKFFMFLHTYQCHTPYEDRYFLDREKPRGYIERRKALYDGDIRNVDLWFGQLVAKLEALGLLSNTIVVVVSDHGEDFHDHFVEEDMITSLPKFKNKRANSRVRHGHSLYDELVKILMVFHFPGFEPSKNVFENQIRIIDVMPTVLDYLGIPQNELVQGTSLLGLMKTGERDHDPVAISEALAYGPERKSVRMDGYKYIYTVDPNERRTNITYRNIPRHALFDLKRDPEEKNNIYDQDRERADEYHRIMERKQEESIAIKNELKKRYKTFEPAPKEQAQDVVDALKTLGYL